MAFRKITQTGYGQRTSGSLKGIVGGVLMFLTGTWGLFINEGNFVKTKSSLIEAESVVVRMDDVSTIDPAYEGKLVHASAFADTKDVVADEAFGVSEQAIAVSRDVAYYQYEEKSRTRGSGDNAVTEYRYEKTWSSSPISSATFHDMGLRGANIVLVKVENRKEHAKNVTFGGYRLPDFFISSITGRVAANVNLSTEQRRQWEQQFTGKSGGIHAVSETIAGAILGQSGEQRPAATVHVNGNTVYFGRSPSSPNIGDVRINLWKIMPADISIIAKVTGSTFEPYIASNGKSVSEFAMGTVSAEKMFSSAHTENVILTWVFRFFGILMVVGGLKLMFSILPAILSKIPLLGNIVSAGVKLMCLVFGSAWSIFVMAVAWLFYRPVIGLALLVAAIVGVWFLKTKAKKKSVVS